jgi:hypothetical protein
MSCQAASVTLSDILDASSLVNWCMVFAITPYECRRPRGLKLSTQNSLCLCLVEYLQGQRWSSVTSMHVYRAGVILTDNIIEDERSRKTRALSSG